MATVADGAPADVTTFLSVAPHPDDEVLGAGPLSLALLDAGHEVHVVCASLGRPDQHDRRRAEATAAAEVGGWLLHLPSTPVDIGRGADPVAAERALRAVLEELARDVGADVVIGPGPHDAHHGHELVGRAIRDELVTREGRRWWAWQVWGHLPVVDLVHAFDDDLLARASAALACHAGEVARNDYDDVLLGAARLGAGLAGERLLGFGAVRPWTERNATPLCESVATGGTWAHTRPHVLSVDDPLAGVVDPARSSAWLHHPSPYS